jgi:proteasome lid subunit RPN8/RPN11
MLHLTESAHAAIAGHAYDGLPDEACGLLIGHLAPASIVRFHPSANLAHSSKVYTVDPGEHLRADRAAEADGMEIIGVMHSHTHSDAYPSPTDVAQAPDPSWHYLIVSLRDAVPAVRSFRIIDETIAEESIDLIRG